MNYEQKYNEALQKAKEEYNRLGELGNESMKRGLEVIFPELVESEDERIRKELIVHLQQEVNSATLEANRARWKKMLNWVKKQKEHRNEDEFREGYLLGFEDGRKEQKPVDIELIQRSWYMEGYDDRSFGKEPMWVIKTGEGGPRYEKNEKYGQALELTPVDKCKGCNNAKGCINCVDGSEWAHIEEIKQKPAEWSEEDEALIENVCTALKGYALHERKVDLDEHAHRLEEMSERLKFLRPKPHWKPSEEQMETLEQWLLDNEFKGDSRYVYPIFESLYNDLKKLM